MSQPELKQPWTEDQLRNVWDYVGENFDRFVKLLFHLDAMPRLARTLETSLMDSAEKSAIEKKES
jgi:hypothetical protein